MEIDSNKLSKKLLAHIVDQFRPLPVTDKLLAELMRNDMISEALKIPGKMEFLDKKMKSMLIPNHSSKKRIWIHNDLVKQYNRLGKRGSLLLKQIEDIEAAHPELKQKESESCQET